MCSWLADGDLLSLETSIAFLVIGLLLIGAVRRKNVRRAREMVPEFSYGLENLGCLWSGLKLTDVISMYLLCFLITSAVVLVTGESLVEVWGAMYFILTGALCLTYPLFYHPTASELVKVADALRSMSSKIRVRGFAYARGCGLLVELEDGLLSTSIPPFSEAVPFTLLSAIKKSGGEVLDDEIIFVKPEEEWKERFSLLSLADWHLPPILRREEGWRSLNADGLLYRASRGTLNLPHPRKRWRRIEVRGEVFCAHPGKRKIKRTEKSYDYSVKLVVRFLAEVRKVLEAPHSSNSATKMV